MSGGIINLLLVPDSVINLIASKLFAYNHKILSHFIFNNNPHTFTVYQWLQHTWQTT